MVTRLSIRLVLACILASCAGYCASGQTTVRITGVIKDPSGGLVAKADVPAVNEATNETWSATTDQEGAYSFFLLPLGLYLIEVAATGFKTVVLTDVVARITETTVADVTLAIGARVETIFVKGNSAPLLPMDGPQQGAVVDSQAVANLPLASRNFTQILTLSPGTATYLPDSTALARPRILLPSTTLPWASCHHSGHTMTQTRSRSCCLVPLEPSSKRTIPQF